MQAAATLNYVFIIYMKAFVQILKYLAHSDYLNIPGKNVECEASPVHMLQEDTGGCKEVHDT